MNGSSGGSRRTTSGSGGFSEFGEAASSGERVSSTTRGPAEPDVVRLLPPLDPFIQARDKGLLVPDKVRQKEVWKIIGNPGVLLADGEIAATWRTKATGRKRLDFTISAFETLPPPCARRPRPKPTGSPPPAASRPPRHLDLAPERVRHCADVDIWRFEYFRCNRWWSCYVSQLVTEIPVSWMPDSVTGAASRTHPPPFPGPGAVP